jgi:uncharacterized FlaG/YvyC family protein
MEITKIQGMAAAAARPPERPERRRPPGPEAAEAPGAPKQAGQAGRPGQEDRAARQRAAVELGQALGLQVELSHDEATGREVVRIFSEDGQRLLRQLPPEQVLRMAAQARDGSLEGVLSSLV